MNRMHTLPHRQRRRAALALLLAAAGCATVSGKVDEMKADRTLLLLSDKPAPRRGCSILREPSALPSVADLADSSALAAAVLGVAREGRITDPQTYMVLSLEILPDGSVGRLRAIDWFMPAALNYTLEVAVRERLRQSSVGAGNVRLRVEPTTGVVRVGRSEQCPPVETMRFELYAPATMGRLNLQPAVLRLRVLADGAVAGVTVMRSTGDGEIDRWIVSKVPERRYHPALIDGIAVPMDYEQTVRVRQR